ncbi:Rad1-domain-containing protein [Thelephora ganbajun]|uniref:Rad1-domain-containing protein n=1 Tax=Thelephora ganbajun TaxID=370292 RepID=A0ACB6ZX27_THEGA|nr:Rad1-domain-containing protein [Thelephora ganbajun]
MSQSQQPEQRRQVLSVSVSDVRYFAALLRGVGFVTRATVTITNDGFTVTVEEARTLLATAFVFKDMFEEYTYHPEPLQLQSQPAQGSQQTINSVAFEIPLNTLIECLNIFGTSSVSTASKTKKWKQNAEDGGMEYDNDRTGPLDRYFPSSGKGTAMRMSYDGTGHPLTLHIAEDAAGPTATCQITTYDPEPQLELPFDDKAINPPPRNRAPRAPSKPILRIHAAGPFGSCEMDYPNDREVLENFECEEPVTLSYKLSHISRAIRALQNSTKTSLRIDNEGFLCLQLLMPSPGPRGGNSEAFTEFRCLPLDEIHV